MKILRFLPLVICVALCSVFYRAIKPSLPSVAMSITDLAVPYVELPSVMSDNPRLLSDIPGPFVLHIFASWCQACQDEHKLFMELSGRQIPVYGVAWKDSKAGLDSFITRFRNPYHDLFIDDSSELYIGLGVKSIPTSFVINQQGRITHKLEGPLTPNILHEIVQSIR